MGFAPIRTERLLLRTVRPDDAVALAARRNDPEVAEYQTWLLPYPLERAEETTAEIAAMPEPVPDEWWMLTVCDADDTTVLGDLALHLTWDGRSAEVGYTFARSAWGNGYALEAVEALIARLFESARVTRVSGMLHPDNVASAQVLERCGLVFEGHTKLSFWVGDDNSDDLIYGTTRASWEAWTSRPRHAPDTVELHEVTAATSHRVGRLATHHSQRRFVSPIEATFRDTMFPLVVDGAPLDPWLRAIVADGEPVGVVLMARPTADRPRPYLWRLMIDRLHQRRGIGARVIEAVVEDCRRLGATELDVCWTEGRGSPAPMYLRRGFVPTGRLVDGETEARLAFG